MAAPFLPGKTGPDIAVRSPRPDRHLLNVALSVVLGILTIVGIGFFVITKTPPRWLSYVFSLTFIIAIIGIVCNKSTTRK